MQIAQADNALEYAVANRRRMTIKKVPRSSVNVFRENNFA